VCCLLQLLDRDLEEAEGQHQAALRSHLMVLDSLLDLQVRQWMYTIIIMHVSLLRCLANRAHTKKCHTQTTCIH
jgi:hypothetical protein